MVFDLNQPTAPVSPASSSATSVLGCFEGCGVLAVLCESRKIYMAMENGITTIFGSFFLCTSVRYLVILANELANLMYFGKSWSLKPH